MLPFYIVTNLTKNQKSKSVVIRIIILDKEILSKKLKDHPVEV